MNRFHHEKPLTYTPLEGRIVKGNVSTAPQGQSNYFPIFCDVKISFTLAAIIPKDHLMRSGGKAKTAF
ncbi:MAG: hypothetical protein CL763_05955 [Chloroflexi bacterium]|nr:hypothetical protein [Chloroflexota bacterium]|tara:strand:+ start:909 stop:1112 length:204 start_codon:yes stop_codon:yes gene_type:complete